MNTKEKILNTAKRLYLENGFENTPNTLIAKEAGVNLGLVTYYYKTKDLIASEMLNNNYETLYSHILEYLPEGDELLLLITFSKLHYILTDVDERYDHFMYEMNKLDLLEKATRDGNLINLYRAIIDKNDHIKDSDKDKSFECAVATSFGVTRSLTMRQFEKKIHLTKEELFILILNQMLYSMDIDGNNILFKSLINSASCIVNQLLDDYPELRKVSNYLYIKEPIIVCKQ